MSENQKQQLFPTFTKLQHNQYFFQSKKCHHQKQKITPLALQYSQNTNTSKLSQSLNKSPLNYKTQISPPKSQSGYVNYQQQTHLKDEIASQLMNLFLLVELIEQLKFEQSQNQMLKMKLCSLQNQFDHYKNQIQYLSTINIEQMVQNALKQIEMERQKFNEQKNSQTKKLQEMNKKLESLEKRIDRKLKNFESLDEYFKEMDSQSLLMEQLIRCKFCDKKIENPITLIPCAHNYCLDCKQGYKDMCYQCGDNVRI